MKETKLVFERSTPGKRAWQLTETTVPAVQPEQYFNPNQLRKDLPNFPELAEIDIVRHFTELSNKNHGVDSGFYPLGSCTMKYNPKINEDLVKAPALQELHPLAPAEYSQGVLFLLKELQDSLAEITGMDSFTLQPAAGAHGELTAMFIIRAYHGSRGATNRTKVLVPTSAHGTNPASAAMAGMEIVAVNCNSEGLVDLEHLRSLLGPDVAALMLTNPNTLGLFEREITEIAAMVHQAGGLLYYDGANLNAIMGLVRPGDMGFDLVHLNLHKTFATPHGGGGPGAGPVGVKVFLSDFLPVPVLAQENHNFYWDYDRPLSIGRVGGFYGNLAVLLKALLYIRAMGGLGLKQASLDAILNANYIRSGLPEQLEVPYNRPCMHELVISAQSLKAHHVKALDIAKRLIDFGYHPPTIYFPLVVQEALMIEPTETEGKATLDAFLAALTQISQEATTNPEILTAAPHQTPVSRVDEARAARQPKLRWEP